MDTVQPADVRELIVSSRNGVVRVAVAFETKAGALGRRATTRRAHALVKKLVLEGAMRGYNSNTFLIFDARISTRVQDWLGGTSTSGQVRSQAFHDLEHALILSFCFFEAEVGDSLAELGPFLRNLHRRISNPDVGRLDLATTSQASVAFDDNMYVESYGNSSVLDLVDAAGQPLALPAWWMQGVTFHVGMCLGYQANAELPLKITTKVTSDGSVASGTLTTGPLGEGLGVSAFDGGTKCAQHPTAACPAAPCPPAAAITRAIWSCDVVALKPLHTAIPTAPSPRPHRALTAPSPRPLTAPNAPPHRYIPSKTLISVDADPSGPHKHACNLEPIFGAMDDECQVGGGKLEPCGPIRGIRFKPLAFKVNQTLGQHRFRASRRLAAGRFRIGLIESYHPLAKTVEGLAMELTEDPVISNGVAIFPGDLKPHLLGDSKFEEAVVGRNSANTKYPNIHSMCDWNCMLTEEFIKAPQLTMRDHVEQGAAGEFLYQSDKCHASLRLHVQLNPVTEAAFSALPMIEAAAESDMNNATATLLRQACETLFEAASFTGTSNKVHEYLGSLQSAASICIGATRHSRERPQPRIDREAAEEAAAEQAAAANPHCDLPVGRGLATSRGRAAGRGRGRAAGRGRGRGRGRGSGTASAAELLLPDLIQPLTLTSKLWSATKKAVHVKGLGQNKALQLHALYPTCAELSEASREGAHGKVEALKARLKEELLAGQKLPQAPVLESRAPLEPAARSAQLLQPSPAFLIVVGAFGRHYHGDRCCTGGFVRSQGNGRAR